MVLAYLASPFSHPDQTVMDRRFQDACKAVGLLIARGTFAFSPIAHNVASMRASGAAGGWDRWGEFDREMLRRCDCLLVLQLDGWEESVGVKAEIEYASALGKQIEYLSPADVMCELPLLG